MEKENKIKQGVYLGYAIDILRGIEKMAIKSENGCSINIFDCKVTAKEENGKIEYYIEHQETDKNIKYNFDSALDLIANLTKDKTTEYPIRWEE